MTNFIDNRPLFQLTVSEFQNLLNGTLPKVEKSEPTVQNQRIKISGIRGLAKFLEVSIPTAQKLKKEKRFEVYTTGNKVFFYSDEIEKGLKEKGQKS